MPYFRRLHEILRMLNYDRLAVFYQVVRHGGIAAAARKVPALYGLSAISKHILLLEQELGVRLFSRAPFRLTREGRALFAPLPAMAETLEQITQTIRPGTGPRFRLGVEDELRQGLCYPPPSNG